MGNTDVYVKKTPKERMLSAFKGDFTKEKIDEAATRANNDRIERERAIVGGVGVLFMLSAFAVSVVARKRASDAAMSGVLIDTQKNNALDAANSPPRYKVAPRSQAVEVAPRSQAVEVAHRSQAVEPRIITPKNFKASRIILASASVFTIGAIVIGTYLWVHF